MWWSRSVAVAFPPYLNTGAETSSAGKTTCSAPHTNPRCAAVATGPESPAEARSPRIAPQPVPYPQWTRLENRASAASSSGSTFRTFSAASAGVWLAPRPLSFISSVLDTVITAVPARPANRPLPKSAATSPRLVLISCSFRMVALFFIGRAWPVLWEGRGCAATECAESTLLRKELDLYPTGAPQLEGLIRLYRSGDGLLLGEDVRRVEGAA